MSRHYSAKLLGHCAGQIEMEKMDVKNWLRVGFSHSSYPQNQREMMAVSQILHRT